MPIPLLAGAAIQGGANLTGGMINAFATHQQNRRSEKFSREMYQRQYQDNIAFWRMQNEYNSPQAQMQRFQAAGLNPHLIYGQGNAGNAGPIATPDVQTPQYRTPEWGNAVSSAGLSFINAIYDLDIKQAQLDNLKAQNTVIQNEGNLKDVNARRAEFNLALESELRDISADSRREQLRQLKTSTDLSINKDAREAASNASYLSEAYERMKSMQVERINKQLEQTRIRADVKRLIAEKDRIEETTRQLQKDGILKDLDIELRKQGINPQDPMWSRIVGRILTNFFDDSGELRTTEPGQIWRRLFNR